MKMTRHKNASKLAREKQQLILAFFLSLVGCELIGPPIHDKLELIKPRPSKSDVEVPEYKPLDPATPKTTKVERFQDGSGDMLGRTAGNGVPGVSTNARKGDYNLNFNEAELAEVVRVILGDILGQNYNMSPKVNGKVNLQTTQPLTREELIPTLEMLLSLNNAGLTYDAGIYTVLPSNEALYSSAINNSASMLNGYQVKVIPVKNVSATELSELLKPVLPEKFILKVDEVRNIMLVAGSSVDLARAMDFVRIFDVSVLKGKSFALFTPAHVSAAQMIKELEEIFGKKAQESSDAFYKFVEIERLNSILAITHNSNQMNEVETWVLRMDRKNNTATSGLNFYKVQHVSALDLAETLNNLFTGAGGRSGSSRGSVAAGRRAVSMNSSGGGAGGANSSSGLGGIGMGGGLSGSSGGIGGANSFSSGGSGGGVGGSSSSFGSSNSGFGTDTSTSSGLGGGGGMSAARPEMPNVRIIPDELNNSLIIMATAQEYEKIMSVVKQIDVLPLQVMIDATIVEVALTDKLSYGIQWFLTHENGGKNAISGGGSEGLNLTSIGTTIMSGGFSYAYTNSKDIYAVLNASANNGNLNVISSPSLMVVNNQEASIKVGDSIPIRSSVSTPVLNSGPTSSPIQTSSIQMTDTGIILKVKPRVNAGGLVWLGVSQSANNQAIDPGGNAVTNGSIESPTIQKREIETNVVVQSGETIVLGGLIKNENNYTNKGVPFLSTIPVIGPIFGSVGRNNIKTELVVLLTPRVVKSRQDAQDVTEEFKQKLNGIFVYPDQTQ